MTASTPLWVPIVVAFLGGGALSALILALSNRAKTKAETSDIIGQSWERVIARLEAIIARLEVEKKDEEARGEELAERVQVLEREVEALRTEVSRLRRLLVTNGIDPGPPKE